MFFFCSSFWVHFLGASIMFEWYHFQSGYNPDLWLLLNLWVVLGRNWCMYHLWKYQVNLHWSPWFSAACAAAIAHRNDFFLLCQNLLHLVIIPKGFLKLPNLVYANKTKESITLQILGSSGFQWIISSLLNQGKSAVLPLFNGPEVLSSASYKVNVSDNSNFDDSSISLPAFSSRTNLKPQYFCDSHVVG